MAHAIYIVILLLKGENMNKFVIFGDSTCDLTPEQRKEHNIEYVKMMVNWTDKSKNFHEIKASLEWDEISFHDYVELMRNGVTIMTSMITEDEFDKKFIPHLEKGEDILYIACSSGLSASGALAQRLFKEKYSKDFPKSKIVVIDSLTSCMAQGIMLLDAAEMRDQGKTIDEIAKYMEENKKCYSQAATVEDLTTLAKHGRVKAAAAFFGNIFGVKPMLISDAKGMNFAVEKEKGRRNALLRIVSMVKERVVKPEEQDCYVTSAEAKQEDIDLLVNGLKELGFRNVFVQNFGPIISASCGPACIGAYYKGQPETRIGE